MHNTEPVQTRWNHTPATWAKREYFANLLQKACGDKELDLTWLDDEKWAGMIKAKDNTHAAVYGYDLGLNSSAAAKIADSKADTYQALRYHNIAAIPHARITPHLTSGETLGSLVLARASISAVGLPLVAKPDASASGGKGVTLCSTGEDVFKAVDTLTADGAPAAVSPFISFDEYRVVVLQNNPRAVIAKTKEPDGWMHNKSRGAEHRLMSPEAPLYNQLGSLGVRAACALGLQFATIDIAQIHGSKNDLAILEANDAVSLVHPGSPEVEELAREIYGDAAQARIDAMR